MASEQKARYRDRTGMRLYPMGALNSWTARPLSALLAWLRFTPNQVSLMSLLVSLTGMALVAMATWPQMAAGALLVHVGLVLDHADGQVARRRGMGSTWGMYLDMVVDRIVEVGIMVALAAAVLRGPSAVPGRLPAPWAPLGQDALLVAIVATLGIMMIWRFLTAYNDVLYLRGHLLATGRMPAEGAAARSLAKRPIMPLVFNRDWVLAFWVVGVVLHQIQALVLLLLVTHSLVLLEKVLVFRVRHRDPEGDARRILREDYH